MARITGWVGLAGLALSLASCGSERRVGERALAELEGPLPPAGTPDPENPCMQPRVPSAFPNRSIQCPFKSVASGAGGSWQKADCIMIFLKWYTGCSADCNIDHDPVEGDANYFAYCDPGGFTADPYFDGCESVMPPPPSMDLTRHSQMFDTEEECQTAQANLDCEATYGTVDFSCMTDPKVNDQVQYQMGINGRCCELGRPIRKEEQGIAN